MSEHANTFDATPRARPHWWPGEEQWQPLPAGLREAAEGTVLPAHEELVLPARSALERAAAGTLVYLIWLELLQQTRLSQTMLDPASGDAPDNDDRAFKNHMRLLSAKNQAFKLLEQARRVADDSLSVAVPQHPPAQEQPRVASAEPARVAPRSAETTTPRSAQQSAPRAGGHGRRAATTALPLSGGVSAAAWEVASSNLSESQREALRELFGGVPGIDREISSLSICGAPSLLPPPKPAAR